MDVYQTALEITKQTDSDFFQVCDWLNDDDGIGLRTDQMTLDELIAAWQKIGCTYEYSKED
jgi:hypothetical protein